MILLHKTKAQLCALLFAREDCDNSKLGSLFFRVPYLFGILDFRDTIFDFNKLLVSLPLQKKRA